MATKKTSKKSYKIRMISDAEIALQKIERSYVAAFEKGYSVIEIARVARMKSAAYVHAALVRKGKIPGAKRGRQPKAVQLPKGFEDALKSRGLTFSKWCAGWRFDQAAAVLALESREGPVIDAIKRDFPRFYSELTGAAVDYFESSPEHQHYRFSVECDWDGVKECYSASIPELDICTYGGSYSEAFDAALVQRRWRIAAARLDSLRVLS